MSDPSTRTEWTEVPAGTADDVDEAFDAAKRTQESWAERGHASGIGRFHGDAIVDELTETKWISVQREQRSLPF